MGCANCGLSFCSKCLKQKHKVPSRGPDEYNVCKLCFSKLSSTNSNINSNIVPPDVFLKYVSISLPPDYREISLPLNLQVFYCNKTPYIFCDH